MRKAWICSTSTLNPPYCYENRLGVWNGENGPTSRIMENDALISNILENTEKRQQENTALVQIKNTSRQQNTNNSSNSTNNSSNSTNNSSKSKNNSSKSTNNSSKSKNNSSKSKNNSSNSTNDSSKSKNNSSNSTNNSSNRKNNSSNSTSNSAQGLTSDQLAQLIKLQRKILRKHSHSKGDPSRSTRSKSIKTHLFTPCDPNMSY
ncbi:hypothetical protein AVEN_231516-1 [Araneus ventricosus]|uniref:Uncharacterized protein n=1 Tax=Araneus ventricosus TaxID=182803 RepID=A0A4Y2IBG7_ARAVE|nr:hypothetical protein AVEN_231516-1 [Araneus ventricosus]